MDALNLFIPITKVDAAQRLVYGLATAEVKDRSGEICDYETTKPYYEKWSGDVAKASDGKSLGNLRAMHGKVAAGKVTSINFNDDEKQIEICAKVVDEAEWQKVEEGVYTGFSQGGAYAKKWRDKDGLQRYTAAPTEVSLVDYPALHTATFQMIKADGMVEDRPFHAPEKPSVTNDDVAAKAKALAKAAGDETKWPDQVDAARADLEKAAAPVVLREEEPVAAKAEVAKQAADLLNDVEQVWKSKDGQTFKTKADAVKHASDLAKAATANPLDVATAALAATLNKADLPAEGRKDEAKAGTAMKDGSFPIESKDDLKKAVEAFGRSKNKAAAKRHITKRAKALDATDLLPAEWAGSTAEKSLGAGDLAKLDTPELRKEASLYGVAWLANLLDQLAGCENSVEYDSIWGEYPANLTPELKTRFGTLVTELGDILAEMLDTVLTAMSDAENAEALTRATLIGDLMKAGARHSKGDKANLQKAHDALVALGADCGPAEKAATGDLAKGIDLAKVIAENGELKESMTKAIETMTKASERIVTLEAKVDALEKQPMPGGPRQLQVVDKEGDENIAAVRKLAESGDPDAIAEALIKMSFGRPQRGLPGVEARAEPKTTAAA